MINAGLNWKMAVGALVLGNSIMGMVITVNGRIGATVSNLSAGPSGLVAHDLSAPHPFPGARTCALRVLLQLLCRRISMCARYHLARVRIRRYHDNSQFKKLRVLSVQCADRDWRTMHVRPPHSDLAELREHTEWNSRGPRHHDRRNGWLLVVLLATAAVPLHSLHESPVLLRIQVYHRSDHLPCGLWLDIAQSWRYHQPQLSHYTRPHRSRVSPCMVVFL